MIGDKNEILRMFSKKMCCLDNWKFKQYQESQRDAIYVSLSQLRKGY